MPSEPSSGNGLKQISWRAMGNKSTDRGVQDVSWSCHARALAWLLQTLSKLQSPWLLLEKNRKLDLQRVTEYEDFTSFSGSP